MSCFYSLPDVDECNSTNDICSNSRTCINNPGSYSCDCPNGYTWDGVVCDGRCIADA